MEHREECPTCGRRVETPLTYNLIEVVDVGLRGPDNVPDAISYRDREQVSRDEAPEEVVGAFRNGSFYFQTEDGEFYFVDRRMMSSYRGRDILGGGEGSWVAARNKCIDRWKNGGGGVVKASNWAPQLKKLLEDSPLSQYISDLRGLEGQTITPERLLPQAEGWTSMYDTVPDGRVPESITFDSYEHPELGGEELKLLHFFHVPWVELRIQDREERTGSNSSEFPLGAIELKGEF